MTLVSDLNSKQIVTAAKMLESGQLVAFPTETVYGVGADAENPAAVRQLFALKGRPPDRPVSICVSRDVDLSYWASDIPPVVYDLITCFWPGPLTLVLKKSHHVLDLVSRGKPSVALRCPSHPLAMALLATFKCGQGGIAAPSANKSGHVSPTTAEHVKSEFGLDEKLSLILDGGACDWGIESTILDLSALDTKGAFILRSGVITAAQIAEVLNRYQIALHEKHPSSVEKHYAPVTPAIMLSIEEIHRIQMMQQLSIKVAFLVHTESLSNQLKKHFSLKNIICLPNVPQGFSQQFYAALRKLDLSCVDCILIEAVPSLRHWKAVYDRIMGAIQFSQEKKALLFPELN